MASRSVARLSSAVLIFCVLMSQAVADATRANPAARWQVVLAAGDDAEPVFDNATRALSQRLAAAGVPTGNIHRLSASAGELGTAVEPALANALSRGCAAVPTVVVVSACYSGGFAKGKMAKPNRIVLTAARNDRPSFGCQVHRVYNFFDECLLGALPKSATWRAVADGSRECVRRMERALGEQPSEPQAYFGAGVADLDVGF